MKPDQAGRTRPDRHPLRQRRCRQGRQALRRLTTPVAKSTVALVAGRATARCAAGLDKLIAEVPFRIEGIQVDHTRPHPSTWQSHQAEYLNHQPGDRPVSYGLNSDKPLAARQLRGIVRARVPGGSMAFPNADLILLNGRVFCGLGEAPAQALAVWGDGIPRGRDGGRDQAAAGTCDPGRRPARAARDGGPLRGAPPPPAARLDHGRARRAAAAGAHPRRAPRADPRRGRAHEAGRVDPRPRLRPVRARLNRHPSREELDTAAPDNPVYLVRACGHISIVNSAALTLAGMDDDAGAARRGDRAARGTANRSPRRERSR